MLKQKLLEIVVFFFKQIAKLWQKVQEFLFIGHFFFSDGSYQSGLCR